MRRELGYQNSATIEHLVPKSKGGPDSIWNLAAACCRCNRRRGVTPMEEFELLAKKFAVDKRSEEDAQNAEKKARRRANQEAAIAGKAARLAAETTTKKQQVTIERAKQWFCNTWSNLAKQATSFNWMFKKTA